VRDLVVFAFQHAPLGKFLDRSRKHKGAESNLTAM
jgi:hypothetical protein